MAPPWDKGVRDKNVQHRSVPNQNSPNQSSPNQSSLVGDRRHAQDQSLGAGDPGSLDLAVDLVVQDLVVQISHRLLAHRETLAFAESCTGGRASAMIVALTGVSRFFLGSVVAYANEAKANLLDVPKTLLESAGAVSAPVALQMARGARQALQSTWAVSITGIAGPDGGSAEKPVGTVFFGISGPGIEETEKLWFRGTRAEIQQASAAHALRFLLRFLEKRII